MLKNLLLIILIISIPFCESMEHNSSNKAFVYNTPKKPINTITCGNSTYYKIKHNYTKYDNNNINNENINTTNIDITYRPNLYDLFTKCDNNEITTSKFMCNDNNLSRLLDNDEEIKNISPNVINNNTNKKINCQTNCKNSNNTTNYKTPCNDIQTKLIRANNKSINKKLFDIFENMDK